MKIALVTPYDYFHPGGVSEHIGHLRTEFLKLGHQAVVIAPRSAQGGVEVRDGFYGIGRTVTIPANGSRARVTFDVTLYNAVKAMLRRERFDVIHVHEPLIPVLTHMVLLNSTSVNVATFHAARASNPWYTAFKPFLSIIVSRLDARICVSEPARELVSQYFDGPFDIIPNGIDPSRYGDGIEPFSWAWDDIPRILFVGRFDESRKGFKYLLKAMPLVHQQFPKAQLIVVGTGRPERFERIMEEYEIAGVHFVGFVDADELPRYYASCDIFCAPSVGKESFGVVLLEGMASGKPVVATNIPGYATVMTNGKEGLLVEPKDAQALALALVRLLADRELQQSLGEHGQATAEQYAWPRVAARVLDVYERSAVTSQGAGWRQGYA